MVDFKTIGSTSLKGVGDIASGIANSKALDQQRQYTNENKDTLAEGSLASANEYSDYMNPYVESGSNALSGLQGIDTQVQSYGNMQESPSDYTFQMTDYEASPSYDFMMEQGVNALDQSASGDGSLYSGGQQKALLEYGQDLASQDYDNEYARQFSAFQDANNQYQDARDYETNLDQNNYQNEYGMLSDLNNQGYDALSSVADNNNAWNATNLEGQLNYTTTLGDIASAKINNVGNTLNNQANIAADGLEDYGSGFFNFGG